jgi:hypothetical protein
MSAVFGALAHFFCKKNAYFLLLSPLIAASARVVDGFPGVLHHAHIATTLNSPGHTPIPLVREASKHKMARGTRSWNNIHFTVKIAHNTTSG